ncbi:MAG TPA: tRNA glutamyl-Q(34) synthetase GluQRS [Gammaproteobacteria bacterium]
MSYVGRFAPSPTGPLHFGSLLTAVASFLHARQAGGAWLVRIEDIDPPREVPGAAAGILRTLEAMELHWDGPVLYQSTRLEAYADALWQLVDRGAAFHCSCTRRDLRTPAVVGGAPSGYPGTCRNRRHHGRPTAVRMRVDGGWEPFTDALQGRVEPLAPTGYGDYLIWRRDGLPAYHLAVVVDDGYQGVTSVVRGRDLLECVPAQRHLQRALGLPTPAYFHLPVVVTAEGQKLSKQTGARAIDASEGGRLAADVLARLGAPVPRDLVGAAPRVLWEWAAGEWRIDALAGIKEVPDRA